MDDLTGSSDSSDHGVTRAVLLRRRNNDHSSAGNMIKPPSSSSSQAYSLTSSTSSLPTLPTDKVLDENAGGQAAQAWWKMVVETVLIFGALVLAAWKTPLVYHPANQAHIATWYIVVISTLFERSSYCQFPQVLYLLLFPPLLCLVTDNADLLTLNLTLSLAALPLPYSAVRALSLIGNDESVYWVQDFHYYCCRVIEQTCSTSLTFTEVSLFASLIVNAVASFKAEYSQTIILISLVSLVPALPWLERLTKLSHILGKHKRPKNSEELKQKYAFLAVASCLIASAGLLLLTLGLDGIMEMTSYLFETPHLYLLAYWFSILGTALPLIMRYSPSWRLDLRRKVWHGMIVVMFLPAVCIDWAYTSVCMSVAIVLFLLVEIARATAMPPFGLAIHQALLPYTDPRDTCGPVIVSHIFLLLGISLPVIISRGSPAGIICLGLGDASASIIGRRFGRNRGYAFFGSPKTIEGTAAFVVAAVVGLMGICWNPWLRFERLEHMTFAKMVVVGGSTALLEASSGMNDNVIVPLYMLIVLELLA